MTTERTFRTFVAQLEELRKQVNSRSAAPQLSHSSFDSGPGHSIDEINPETGNVVASYGTQFDGSHGAVPFTGPIPPVPTAPEYAASPGVLSIVWDGRFLNELGLPDNTVVATLDWTHAEAHASQDPNFTAEFADTIVGTINTARGGLTTAALPAGTWYIRLVSRSGAGKRSAASPVVTAVVPATVDVGPILAELDAADDRITTAQTTAAAALGAADTALSSSDAAAAQALAALGAAQAADAAADAAAADAAAAQTTAGNAATAADTAQTTAGNAATAAATATTEAAKANKKITVSANVPSGTGNPGDLWYRKNTATPAAIIGIWEWATTPTPAGWKARTTDGSVVSNMSIVNLVAGTGTMATGVIDKIFADVVVAKTSVTATAFIGTDAIITGAITAPKITASEELTAKVAQFLEVTADMIETNSLWADTAWIAAARAHILTVLQNTNGQGYTSTITGQGLKVTRTIGGITYDVIRLGTFGADYISISDGEGKAVAAISGAGDVGAKTVYSQGSIYSEGSLVSDVSGPKGEVAYGAHTYLTGNPAPTSWSTTNTAGAGLIEVKFTAERGRAYRLFGNLRSLITVAVPERVAIKAVYKLGGGIPTIASNDGAVTVPYGTIQPGEETRLSFARTTEFGGRFVPLPFNSPTFGNEIEVRVLVYAGPQLGRGTLVVEYVDMSIVDMGVVRALNPYYGQNNGAGTSTLPASTDYNTAWAPVIRVWKRPVATPGASFARDFTVTTELRQGRIDGFDWISSAQFDTLRNEIASGLTVNVDWVALEITPAWFQDGMGQLVIGQAPFSSLASSLTLPTPAYPEAEQVVGAWPIGQARSIKLTNTAQNLLRAGNNSITFGMTIPAADFAKPQYAVKIPLASLQARMKYRKRA